MTTLRRCAAALVASAVLGLTAAPAALAAPSPAPSSELPGGLYGKSDPTYDGVWRQSLALLAQDTAGVKPADEAVTFLTGQQCANGGFPSYRADTAKGCDAAVPLDTNASGAAVQALAALGGQDAAVKKTVDWLKSVQNEDGGWGYNPGGASDANSTSLVIGALAAAGERPADAKSPAGKTPYDALLTFAKPCGGEDGGAFVYQVESPGMVADSTAAAVLASHGKGLAATGGDAGDVKGTDCEKATTLDGAAHNGAAYLANGLAKTGHFDTPPMPGADDSSPKPDFGNTADAVVALSVQGRAEQAEKPLEWLRKNSAAWAKENGPAAYAQLIFAARAAGADPKDFGGTDLVAALSATGPAPQAAGAKSPAAKGDEQAGKDDTKADDDSSSFTNWWIVGVLFVAAVGAGFLLSGRRKNQS
ncbi:prenyltransferase/squalene oxidase repeat-containing protein [Streptomyces sp. NPDC048389]|uniref:prenyltransferase/squalene oxidase repeat-containing protein n=1 Tax=Streptomyces sp. NPDC048389 TaxID=3154622 RepID=UPI0034558791